MLRRTSVGFPWICIDMFYSKRVHLHGMQRTGAYGDVVVVVVVKNVNDFDRWTIPFGITVSNTAE